MRLWKINVFTLHKVQITYTFFFLFFLCHFGCLRGSYARAIPLRAMEKKVILAHCCFHDGSPLRKPISSLFRTHKILESSFFMSFFFYHCLGHLLGHTVSALYAWPAHLVFWLSSLSTVLSWLNIVFNSLFDYVRSLLFLRSALGQIFFVQFFSQITDLLLSGLVNAHTQLAQSIKPRSYTIWFLFLFISFQI